MIGECRACRWWAPIDEDPGMGLCGMLSTFDSFLPIRLHLGYGRGDAVITPELLGCNQFEAKPLNDHRPTVEDGA